MPLRGSASESADKRERSGLMSMRECRSKKAEKGELDVCNAGGTSHREDVQETVVERSEDSSRQKGQEIRFDVNT